LSAIEKLTSGLPVIRWETDKAQRLGRCFHSSEVAPSWSR